MSIIPKLWNLQHCKNIISTTTSNLNRHFKSGSVIIERFLSKRFTIGKTCKKPKPKKIKCEGELSKRRSRQSQESGNKQCPECPKPEKRSKPKRGKPVVTDVCTPFRKKEKKIPSKTNIKKKPKCKAGMKGPCEEQNECMPNCSLTKGTKQLSSNECPKELGSGTVKKCPKGDWERED